jgi:hypothetical protein
MRENHIFRNFKTGFHIVFHVAFTLYLILTCVSIINTLVAPCTKYCCMLVLSYIGHVLKSCYVHFEAPVLFIYFPFVAPVIRHTFFKHYFVSYWIL